jgi:Fe-S oxidoreductase
MPPGPPSEPTLRGHGITAGEWLAMYEHQAARCAVCGRIASTLHVDHDHKLAALEGRRRSVRGLLCPWCNRLVGVLKDNPERAQQIADYLRNPPAHAVLDRGEPKPVASRKKPAARRRRRRST